MIKNLKIKSDFSQTFYKKEIKTAYKHDFNLNNKTIL